MGNTFRFLWEVEAIGDPAYAPQDSTSGSRREVLFVPYDNTERTYTARAKAISNNGTSDSEWSERTESAAGKYQGWYRLTGATGYDIFSNNEESNLLYGRDRTQMSLTGNIYTVEKTAGPDEATYNWSIIENPGDLASLGDEGENATVDLQFDESILENTDLVNHPDVAKTFVLQCVVNDGREDYTLTRTITVGDRDECSPVAGLRDAEENFYTVSKFGGACWMTQNLRSTYTWQGNQKQEPTYDRNVKNNNNAVSYSYPGSVSTIPDDGQHPEYGYLYTWGAANIGTLSTEATNAFLNTSSTRQGICPEGWVVPSDYDFNQLEKEIATNPALYSTQEIPFEWSTTYENTTEWRPSTGNTAQTWWGRQMKSPTQVTTTNPSGSSKTDGTGFNALLVGTLDLGASINYGTYSFFWSSSANGATVSWRRNLGSSYSGARRTTTSKYNSFSVRCKKL
jgi:uncharacterized protein (TIGR02145 family)